MNAADMSKTIKDKMDDTCHMKYIDHFYQLVIKSILTYLTDVYGHEYMAGEPSVLLEENETHIGPRVGQGGGGGGGGRATSPRQYNPRVRPRFDRRFLDCTAITRLTNAPCCLSIGLIISRDCDFG